MTGVPRKPLPVLSLSQATVGRAGWNRSRDDLAGLLDDPRTRVLDVRGDLLPLAEGTVPLRAGRPDDASGHLLYLGEDAEGVHHLAVLGEAPEPTAEPTDGAASAPEWVSLRQAGPLLDPTLLGLATTAVAMANWHASVRYCARCGGPVTSELGGWLLRCPQGHESYPQTSPAVIMAVVDDADRLLLARGPRWGERNRSVLAGFVEPGESLEAAVAREVREEVGLDVDDVRYQGNQPWPFPASLMVAFTCRATSTELSLDPEEILDAEWYSREELRAAAHRGDVSLPAPLSVAHHLVAQWYGGPPPGARPV